MATTTATLIDGLGGKGFYAQSAGLALKAIGDEDGNQIKTTYVKSADLPTVDQTYNATSENAQSGKAVAQAISSQGNVPTVQSTDDGKVLKATYSGGQGSYTWDSAPSGVPTVQAADVGKVLGVKDSTGALQWVNQTQHIQSNWNEADSSSDAYIQNKPTIPNPANNATITVQIGSTSIGSFTTDQLANSTITIPEASTTVTGAMSSADKAKLDGIAVGAQVNVKPNWNAASGADAEILNKPDLSIYALSSSLAPVATSGSYNDLTDKPSIPTIPVNDVEVDGSSVVNSSGVAQIQLPTFTQVNHSYQVNVSTSSDVVIDVTPSSMFGTVHFKEDGTDHAALTAGNATYRVVNPGLAGGTIIVEVSTYAQDTTVGKGSAYNVQVVFAALDTDSSIKEAKGNGELITPEASGKYIQY